jgi:hypothetical protein
MHRGRIRKAGRLDDDATELAIVERAQQPLQGIDEIASDGAAQAAGGEQHQPIIGMLDEEMIEADLAEFVDYRRYRRAPGFSASG